MKKLLLILLLAGLSGYAQTYSPLVAPPKMQFFDGNGLPCSGCLLYSYQAGTTTPLATYTDATGTVQNQNPVTIDASGYATVFLKNQAYKLKLTTAAGVPIYTVDKYAVGDATYVRADGTNGPFGSPFAFSGNNSHSGTETFTGAINCTVVNNVACISPLNPQGWAGTDIGAWINSINANPAICATINCNAIQIADGTYNDATPAIINRNMALHCEGPAPFGNPSVINWTPATGTMFTATNSAAFKFDGCFLRATGNTSSVAMQLGRVVQVTTIQNFHISGFTGGIRITGDGVSANSVGVHVDHGLIDGFCGTGSYGINVDHVGDFYYDHMEVYSTNDCATSIPMILDTGTSGAWLAHSTNEYGLHAGVIRNTNQGGAYGGAPNSMFGDNLAWDTSTGGDALLLDSTLGTADLRFFCSNCWFAAAGKNNAGTIVTAGAAGLNAQGGSNFHFVGGTSRVNSSWGAILATAGTNVSIEHSNFHANNQSNTAGVGGILVTAGPTGYRVEGNRSGNIVESGGFQAYGIDLSAAGINGVISGNDLRNNTAGRIKMPAGFGAEIVDAPEYGSPTGSEFMGPLHMPQGTNFSAGTASEAVCGSNATGAFACSYNNGTILTQTQTVASGTATMTTAAITGPNCGATVTAAATGVATTDTIMATDSAAPASTTNGPLVLKAWPTANNVNFAYCVGSGTFTPAAATINFRVVR